MPSMYIIAGCNGAGKTTAAYNLLPGIFKAIEFVNADEIARTFKNIYPKPMIGIFMITPVYNTYP